MEFGPVLRKVKIINKKSGVEEYDKIKRIIALANDLGAKLFNRKQSVEDLETREYMPVGDCA
jgi:hypothetical protein